MKNKNNEAQEPMSCNIVTFPEDYNIQAMCEDDINYREKSEKLWSLLDDIDTASDMFKPRDEASYKAFYNYAMKKCEERGKHLVSLDGYSLRSPEVIKYEQEMEDRFNKFNEYVKKHGGRIDKLVELNDDNYCFKWHQLVMQEIKMWIRINKLVDQEEFDSMCICRGFDKDMKNFLYEVLTIIDLADENLKHT